MRYLVTGGAGFIGSNTVDELVRRGHSVVVLDDLSSGKEDNLAEIRNKITFIKGSITDIEVVRKAMHEAEYVLHLGARTSVPRSLKDPIETNRINIDGTLNVLVAAKELKVKRVVFAASSSAYGETPTLPKSKPCNRSQFLPMASPSLWESFTDRRSGGVTGWKTWRCVTSIFLGRGRIPAHHTPLYLPSFALHFWKTRSRLFSEMASKRGTSPMWRTRSRRICSRAKHPMFLEKFSMSASGDASPSMKLYASLEKSPARRSKRSTIRRAREISVTLRRTFRRRGSSLAMSRRYDSRKDWRGHSNGTGRRKR